MNLVIPPHEYRPSPFEADRLSSITYSSAVCLTDRAQFFFLVRLDVAYIVKKKFLIVSKIDAVFVIFFLIQEKSWIRSDITQIVP